LTKYLVEEAYEALDALTNLATMIDAGDEDDVLVAHAEEELGDLLFQVLFHAELGDEEGRFTLATVADAERDKLTGRHPHVFGDVVVNDAVEVAERWEVLKKAEKGRTGVLEGISWWAPALSLHAKVLHKSRALGTATSVDDELQHLRTLVASLELPREGEEGVDTSDDLGQTLAGALTSLSALAAAKHVDLESLLRDRILALRDQILAIESNQSNPSEGSE
jgi:XTP/dITP diphosphohydrolase